MVVTSEALARQCASSSEKRKESKLGRREMPLA